MTRRLLVLPFIFVLAGSAGAQPKTLDNLPIDPDAELIVAMADDTPNMDPRIGMGSTRSAYIRQVFESLVDTDPQGRPLAYEFTTKKGNLKQDLTVSPPLLTFKAGEDKGIATIDVLIYNPNLLFDTAHAAISIAP